MGKSNLGFIFPKYIGVKIKKKKNMKSPPRFGPVGEESTYEYVHTQDTDGFILRPTSQKEL